MAKVEFTVGIVVILVVAGAQWAQAQSSWAKTVDTGTGNTTTLQFYFHDTVSGNNPSAIKVTQPQNSEKYPTLFGTIMMADDPLTEGHDPTSKPVGRAQGIYASACLEELGFLMAMTYSFTDGIYNGSSISILGRNAPVHPVREMAVVGGTGLFRMARGYALAQTYWFDPSTGDAIVGYNVTAVH